MPATVTHAPQPGWEAVGTVPIWCRRRSGRPGRGCESSSGRASGVASDESGRSWAEKELEV